MEQKKSKHLTYKRNEIIWEKKKSMKQAFQTSDLVDAFVQINNIDMQNPETHSSAYHYSSWYNLALQKGENNSQGKGNIW